MTTTTYFSIGQAVATPGVLAALEGATPNELMEALKRHMSGDWGDVDDEDKASNDAAVKDGNRLLSAYRLSTGVKFWIITEADRSVTTFLLPEEY